MKSLILLTFLSIFLFNSVIAQTNQPFSPRIKPPNSRLKTTGLIFTGIGAGLFLGGYLLASDAITNINSPTSTYRNAFFQDPALEFFTGGIMLVQGTVMTVGGIVMTAIGQHKVNKEMQKRLSFYYSPVSAGFVYKF
jgi:hypothetical protein